MSVQKKTSKQKKHQKKVVRTRFTIAPPRKAAGKTLAKVPLLEVMQVPKDLKLRRV